MPGELQSVRARYVVPLVAGVFSTVVVVSLSGIAASGADTKNKTLADPVANSYVLGAPDNPSRAWTLAAGGRLYDKYWAAQGKDAPTGTHPLYPKIGKVKGPDTFRCKECHGWDYRGKDGNYKSGSHFTGIIGIRAMVGEDPAAIAKTIRAAPHNYSKSMIGAAELARLAAFVSRGQHDARQWIDRKTRKSIGNKARGQGIFQTTCAACHGFDGKLLNWGTDKEPEFVGTAATNFPEEILHKIRNGHPGSIMINLRMLPMRMAADVLAYAQTLPVK